VLPEIKLRDKLCYFAYFISMVKNTFFVWYTKSFTCVFQMPMKKYSSHGNRGRNMFNCRIEMCDVAYVRPMPDYTFY